MEKITLKSFSIKKLNQLFARKIFAIPELQREFVWNAKKACALLDSVYHNLPIGMAMIWQTGRENNHLLRHQLHILPSYDGVQNRQIWYLIDGQQRLSVLYQMFIGQQITNASGRLVDFGRVYFNSDSKSNYRFEYLARPDHRLHFKIAEILSPNWQQHFRNLPPTKLKRIAACRSRILNYRFPTIFVETKEIGEVRETFIRINSRGTPVSAADRAFARATKFNLRHQVKDLLSDLAHGFRALPPEVALQTIAFVFGSHDVGDRAIQAVVGQIEEDETKQDRFAKRWNYVKDGIKKAVDYLVSNLGVINHGFLPSINMVTTLAMFFYHNDGEQPSPAQSKEIRKWFWATGAGQRYTGRVFRKNMIGDVDFFKRLATQPSQKFRPGELIPVSELLRTDYRKRSGLSDTFFCLLALRKPRYFQGGGEIPRDEYSSRANRKDKHHIFPKVLLKKICSEREIHNISNICFLDAEENQYFGSKKPVVYLEEFRHKKHFAQTMSSHLISHGGNSGLWATQRLKKSYKSFVHERAALIVKEFERLAGTKLFQRQE